MSRRRQQRHRRLNRQRRPRASFAHSRFHTFIDFLSFMAWRRTQPSGLLIHSHFRNKFSLSLRKCTQESNRSQLNEVGRMTPKSKAGFYQTGQVFLHRIFGYRGIVALRGVCDVEHTEYGNRTNLSEKQFFYQALIHKGDWDFMALKRMQTAYLADGGLKRDKLLVHISGMDCVHHDDVLPLVSATTDAIDHDLFSRMFIVKSSDVKEHDREVAFELRPELEGHSKAQDNAKFLIPTSAYKEITDHIEVFITTFHMGYVEGKYLWRYVIRIRNLEPQRIVVLKEQHIKIFNNYELFRLSSLSVENSVAQPPIFSLSHPVQQFFSTCELPKAKGGHMWGKFKMERIDRSTFDIVLPNIILETEEYVPPTKNEMHDFVK